MYGINEVCGPVSAELFYVDEQGEETQDFPPPVQYMTPIRELKI